MKKLLLASAVAALSVTAANAAPTVYGKAFLTLDMASGSGDTTITTTDNSSGTAITNTTNQKVDRATNTQLNSNSSRIGFKGSEALTANTDVVYQLEYSVDIDGDSANVIRNRDTYLGLKNAQYGTLLAGHLTTIDDMVDYADVLEGGNIAGDIAPTFNEPRVGNAFAYVSPDYNGMQVLAMYGLDSDQDSGSIDDEEQYGIGAKYATGPFKVGASYIGHGDDNHIRVSGNYVVSPMITVGALYQVSKLQMSEPGKKTSPFFPVGNKRENSFILSGEMATATPWTAYAQLNLVNNRKGFDGDKAMSLGVGGKYAFNKNTLGHVYGGYITSEDTTTEARGSAVAISKDKTTGFGVGGGIEYKF